MNAKGLFAEFQRLSDAPDAVARLRRFVLDLAVRGRLSEQDSAWGSGADLLERIRSEHPERSPTNRLASDFVGPFELPPSWIWASLGELAEFSGGRTPSRNEPSLWNTGDHHWVSIADMIDGAVLIRTKETVSQKAAVQVFRSQPLPPGTMLMSFKLTIGKVARLGVPAYHNEAIINIRPYVLATDPYLFLVLPACARAGATRDAIKGATLNRKSLSNVAVPLPPLEEQLRIVTKVDELMGLCDQLETAQAERERRRDRLVITSLARLGDPQAGGEEVNAQVRFVSRAADALISKPHHVALFRGAVHAMLLLGRLGTQDARDASVDDLLVAIEEERRSSPESPPRGADLYRSESEDPLPPRWVRTTVSQLLLWIQTGPFGSALHKSDYVEGGTPVINPASITNRGIVPDPRMAVGAETLTRLSTYRLRVGDVIVARRGEMGRCAVITQEEEGWLCGTGSLILRLPSGVHPEFMMRLIQAPFAREYLSTSSVGATMQNLNQRIFLKMEVRLPPFAEQLRIVAKVDALHALSDQLERSLTAAQVGQARLLDVVLHEVLAGTAGSQSGSNLPGAH